MHKGHTPITDQKGNRVQGPPKAFDISPEAFAGKFQADGFVHIKNGVAPAFLGFAMEQMAELQAAQNNSLSQWQIKDKKQQFLFEFPKNPEFLPHLLHSVANLAGLRVADMTISERHFKVYAENAAPNPPLHKDRFASQVAVGIPLQVPENSRIILYPNHLRSVNVFDTATALRDHLDEEEPSETGLKDVSPVLLDVQPGDVAIFLGSEIYHERLSAAGAIVLYLKFNAMRLDPLCEDPSTKLQREKSLLLLSEKSDVHLLDSSIEVSPRVQRVSTHHFRLDWSPITQAHVSGEKEITLSEHDWMLLKGINGRSVVRELFNLLGVPDSDIYAWLSRLRRLGKLGVIDFLT